VPTRLARYEKIAADTPQQIAERLKSRGAVKLGEKGTVTPEVVEAILTNSLAA